MNVLLPLGAQLRGASAAAAAARGARRAAGSWGRSRERLSEAGRGGLPSRALRASARERLLNPPHYSGRPRPPAPPIPRPTWWPRPWPPPPRRFPELVPDARPGGGGSAATAASGERGREGVCARV